MSNRVAVVTGAASGIGLGVANRLAADGHAVALLDRDGTGAAAAAEELSSQGSRAISWEVDVADRGELERVFSEVRQQLGPITILVTSAGIESFDAVADITPEKWDRLLAVNLTGTFTCMQLAVPDMTAEGWGRIVTVSSSSAQSGAPNMAHYVASKGGVIGLTKAFARNSPAGASRSTPSRRRSSTRPWPERLRASATCRALMSWERWSRPVGPEHPRTSQPRAPSCARKRLATSPVS